VAAPVPSEEITVANLTPAAPAETPAAPVLTPQQQLAAEYELPNSDFDPDFIRAAGGITTPPAAEPVPQPAVALAAPLPPKHSPRVLRMAADFGIPQPEIDATDPEVLEETLIHLNRQLLADRQRFITQPPTAPAAAAPAAPAQAAAPEKFDLGIPPEVMDSLDPSISGALKKLADEVQELRGLKGKLGTIEQREQQREFNSFQERCDSAFAKHEAILGKGSFGELNQQGPELRRRQAVLDTAQRDNPRIPFEKRIERAVEALFGKQPVATSSPVAPAAPAAPAGPTEADLIQRGPDGRITGRITVEQWNAAATVRPSHRASPVLPPGKERATQFVKEELAKRDYFGSESVNGTAERDEDTIPD
jgi:hypothetical protein